MNRKIMKAIINAATPAEVTDIECGIRMGEFGEFDAEDGEFLVMLCGNQRDVLNRAC